MSNDPKKNDSKSTSPKKPDPSQSIPQNLDDQVFDLSEIEGIPLEGMEEPHKNEPDSPLDVPQMILAPPSGSSLFDLPISSDDPGSLTSGISLGDLPELASIPGWSGHTGGGDPASDHIPFDSSNLDSSEHLVTALDSSDAIGNLEPVAPVEPASGWLDGDSPKAPKNVVAEEIVEALEVHQADLLDAPPAVESSDIFSSGPILSASGTDHSDVISATAFQPPSAFSSGKPARLSEISITDNLPPTGETTQSEDDLLDLPMADDVPLSSDSLFDSAKLATTPPLPNSNPSRHDEADYGATPMATPDASSILADLSDPGEISFDESSAVRIEAPGVRRTLTNNPDDGTEFDLTITDDPISPELDAAAADSGNGDLLSTDWQQQSGSDLFADGRSLTEIDLEAGLVDPISSELKAEEPSLTSSPSSIFSDGKLPGGSGSKSGPNSDSVRIGRHNNEDEDAAVEFSDHPTAELESSSSALAEFPTSEKRKIPPGGKINFDASKKKSSKKAEPETEDRDSGKVDWGMSSIEESNEATLGFPKDLIDAPLSGILARGKKVERPEKETPTRHESTLEKSNPPKQGKGKSTRPVPLAEGTDPSVEIDWMAGSSTEEPAISPELHGEKPASRSNDKEKKEASREKKKLSSARQSEVVSGKKGGGGWIGGTLLGMVIAGTACAGLYFSGALSKSETKTPIGKESTQSTAQAPRDQVPKEALTIADAKAAIDSGDHRKALKVLDDIKAAEGDKASVHTKAALGHARLFAKIQELGKVNAAIAAGDDPDLKKAREELQAVVDDAEAIKTPEGEKAAVKSMIHLGLTYEVAGERTKAKEVYQEGLKKFPKFSTTFQAAIDRLAATVPGSDTMSLRTGPAEIEQLLFASIFLQADAPAAEDEEPGVFFWKAVNLANAGKYGDAVDELKKAKAAHLKQSRSMAGRGINPLSDPLEQIFPRCCDDLKSYWELRSAIYSNKSIAEQIKKDGVEKTLTELAGAQKKATDAVKLMTDLKEATDKLAKADKDFKETQDKLAKADKDFKETQDKLAKADKDFKEAQDKLAKTDKDFKETQDKLTIAEKQRIDNEAKARVEYTKVEENFKKAEHLRKIHEDLLGSLAKELQNAKLLDEKYDSAALLTAQKTAMNRATGPTLGALIPNGMMAIGGGGLTAAQLMDIGDRLTKSVAAIKKLTAEKTQLTTDYAAEMKKIKETQAADAKKLSDDFAAEMKKVMNSSAADTTKLKDEQAAELKKMADKFAIVLKKMTDDNALAVKKAVEGYEDKIKTLEAAVLKEKANAEDMVARQRLDMKNAVPPSQTLDLWLPLLSELRRVSDADLALANAAKVLEAAGPASEEAAKARTVSGLAHMLKGNTTEAKLMFESARSSPAFAAAKGKEWVKVVEIGLASISDPLATYRLPVEKLKRDLKAAARYLDLGINTYKSGRYKEAVSILISATIADPTDALAWYYLGAARWATGSIDLAKEDFKQGGEWEKKSPLTARAFNDNLEAIQGPARDALWVARP